VIRFDRPGPKRILVIGHRGAEALAPENTWAALQQGCESGADLLELDVQLTRNQEAIVFHDFTLQPKLGDPRWVREMTWQELQTLDVGSWFDPAFATERIPRFADVLNWARGRIALQVDLKHGFVEPRDDRLEMKALDLIEAAGMLDQVVISSWDHVALMRIQARCPQVVLGVNLRPRVPDPLGAIAPVNARWVSVPWSQVDRGTVKRLQDAGIKVSLCELFTGDYRQARHLGVDAVTAPDPRAARQALEQPVHETDSQP
jgi:glycerophosphoryl diester phosphodiesterase